MKALKARGVRVLPGGDYGFMWNPHGNNARDLAYFVDLLGFTPMEAIVGATRMGRRDHGQARRARPGARRLPRRPAARRRRSARRSAMLEDRARLLAIMKDGVVPQRRPVVQPARPAEDAMDYGISRQDGDRLRGEPGPRQGLRDGARARRRQPRASTRAAPTR